jgi:hypothetical protein
MKCLPLLDILFASVLGLMPYLAVFVFVMLVAVDYDQRAVVVEYQVEAAVLNETGEVIQVDTRPHRKVYVPCRR